MNSLKPIQQKIRQSIQPIITISKYITLDQNRLVELANQLRAVELPSWNNEAQLKAKPEQTIQYYFFLDSINFCFWALKGKEKWHFNNGNEWLSGYYAYSSAIKKAFESDSRFYDADYLAEIPYEQFAAIFTGKNELLLLKERWRIIQENFQVMSDQYKGQAINLVEASNGDVNTFVDLLLQDFPTFRDQTVVKDQTVYFLKRAQILPSDIAYSLPETTFFNNLDDLSVFADYKLPQLLQAEGVLIYDQELLTTLRNEELIEKDSQMELEIRAWTIQACSLLVEELNKQGRKISHQELDWILWVLAKQQRFSLPHHKTITINY